MPLHDPDAKNAPVASGSHPTRSNGLIGPDPTNPDVVVAANGGSDLVYLPKGDRKLAAPSYVAKVIRSDPAAGGVRTVLNYQLVGKTRYFDAAGFPGRTVGLTETDTAANAAR